MTQSTQLFPKEDYEFILRYRKMVRPSGADNDNILRLYRKHIQWIWGYVDCNCSNGISVLWQTLNEWVIKNDSLFEH